MRRGITHGTGTREGENLCRDNVSVGKGNARRNEGVDPLEPDIARADTSNDAELRRERHDDRSRSEGQLYESKERRGES